MSPPIKSPSARDTTTPANTTWEDLGLRASPGTFMSERYAFTVWPNLHYSPPQDFSDDSDSDRMSIRPIFQTDPSASSFLSPFCDYKVTLRGHIGTEIPWSDPYLLMEWEAFLQKNHVKMKRRGSVTKYSFKGLPVMESVRTEAGLEFKFFNPDGEIKQDKFIKIPHKPRVLVSAPSGQKIQPYMMTVYGRQLPIRFQFSGSLSTEKKVRILLRVAQRFQDIPEALLAPLLDGVEKEKPLKLRVATLKEARQLGWVSPQRSEDGNYNYEENVIFLASWKRHTIFHEVGHAIDDFSAADINMKFHSDSDRSAVRDYYVWRLAKLFSPTDVVDYNKLVFTDTNWEFQDHSLQDQKSRDSLTKELSPFRTNANNLFVSDYALEGNQGLWSQMYGPVEFYAEGMRVFLQGLNGQVIWSDYRSREPLLRLFGLYYLFHQYEVSTIGTIDKDEAFSRKAFQEVLGINLEGIQKTIVQYEEVLSDYDARIAHDPKDVAAYYGRANVHLENGDFRDAIADYGQVIRHFPEKSFVYEQRGASYASLGQHAKAVRDFDEAITHDQNNAELLYRRGASQYELNRVVEAYDDIYRAHQMDPQFKVPWWLKWQRDNLTAYWPF